MERLGRGRREPEILSLNEIYCDFSEHPESDCSAKAKFVIRKLDYDYGWLYYFRCKEHQNINKFPR